MIKANNFETDYTNEIRILCNMLNIEEYLKHPKVYQKHRELLLPLNKFLTQHSDMLNETISKNERAYQIWNDEKILDNSLCKSVIKFNHLDERLNYYLTPEPFFDYIHKKKDKMNILIIENKDTWYTMRKVMNSLSGECCLANAEIDGLLYGEGNKITKEKALEEYENQVIQRKCSFFYWGDLDYTGIEMFERVLSQNHNTSIQLFTKIYEMMIEKKEIDALGKIKHKQNSNISLELFLKSFNSSYQEKIRRILEENRYIPQEVIHAAILKKLCKEKEVL